MRALTRIIPPGAGFVRGLAPVVLVGILAAVAAVVQAFLLSLAVSAAFLRGAAFAALAPAFAAFLVAALVRAACLWAQDVLAQRFSAGVRLDLRDRLVRRLFALGPRFVSGERTGEIVHTLTAGVDGLDAYLAQYLPQAALAACVPTLLLLAVARVDLWSALVLLATAPLIPVFLWLIGDAAQARTRRQWVLLSRLATRFLDALRGLPTLRAFGRDAQEEAAVEQASERHRVVTMDVLRLAFLSAFVLEALATLGTAVVAVEVGLRLLYHRLAFRDGLFVLLLAPEFYRPLRALGASFHARMAGREAALRAGEILRKTDRPAQSPTAPATRRERTVSAHSPASTLATPPAIRFESVCFDYGSDRPPALDGLNLEIPAGSTVGILGPTGAGKSTVAHLLLRFLDPTAGRILADGVPISEVEADVWRSRVAWVPQRPHIFHGTVRGNLLLACDGATDGDLERAVALAHLDEVVRELPRGLDTPLGEDGAFLSGGERQRLALARAFLRNAPILVLDEPTAQLDSANEEAVASAIHRLRSGRTVLLIAHRLTTAARADRIAILAGGRVVEAGDPKALARSGGSYARLAAAWSDA